MLRGAGAAGAVGIAAAVGVGAAGGVAAAIPTPAADNRAAAGHSAGAAGAPLVVYLRDAASGELDIFSGTSHTVLRDRALAARLTSAAR